MRIQSRFSMILLCMILAYCASAFTPKDWTQFNPPPLTIIYPEIQARTNPPFLHWQAAAQGAAYRIRITGKDFHRKWQTSRNFYTPEEALPAGDYVFEVEAIKADGGRMPGSQKKSFTASPASWIPGASLNTIRFPPGSLFLYTKPILESLRKAGGEQAQLRDRLIASARKPPHALLQTLREPATYKNDVWEISQWRKIGDVAFTARDYMINQALAYRLTSETLFRDNALRIAMNVAEWDPRGSTGSFCQDHAAQSFLYSLGIVYNLLRDDMTPAQRERMVRALRLRGEDMYRFLNPAVVKGDMNDPDNNHAWFCMQGLAYGGFALMGEIPEAEEWVGFSAQMFYGVFLPRGGSLGEWHEGIDYWTYTLFFVFQFCDALKTSTGLDFYQHPWLRHTALFKIYNHPPKGSFVPFGDCKQVPANAFDKAMMMRLASAYDDPLAWAYIDAVPVPLGDNRLFDVLPWSERRVAPNTPISNLPAALHFEDIGWVVANNAVFEPEKRSLFAFRCGRIKGAGAHSHPDQNHFIFSVDGDDLIWDAGYYDWYGSPHFKQVTTQSRSHNIILIDDKGQPLHQRGAEGYIRRYSLDGTTLEVEGDASTPTLYASKLTRWIRSIRYEQPYKLQVQDDIALKSPARVTWLLNSAFPISFDPQSGALRIEGKRTRLRGEFVASVPIEAKSIDRFEAEPERPATNTLGIPAKDYRPQQYRLEIRTRDRVKDWKPSLQVTVEPRTPNPEPIIK